MNCLRFSDLLDLSRMIRWMIVHVKISLLLFLLSCIKKKTNNINTPSYFRRLVSYVTKSPSPEPSYGTNGLGRLPVSHGPESRGQTRDGKWESLEWVRMTKCWQMCDYWGIEDREGTLGLSFRLTNHIRSKLNYL